MKLASKPWKSATSPPPNGNALLVNGRLYKPALSIIRSLRFLKPMCLSLRCWWPLAIPRQASNSGLRISRSATEQLMEDYRRANAIAVRPGRVDAST